MYIRRHLENQIIEASKTYPVVIVCGQRQVGKSTMLYHLKEETRRYVTLDDITARRLAEEDPELFLETYEPPLLIDEFQRVPSLLLSIKKVVDGKALSGENTSGLYHLTGSGKFQMMKGISESLAGRAAVFDMAGLSAAEIEGREAKFFSPEISELKKSSYKKKTVTELYEQIFRGGMPKIIADHVERDRYYMDYVNTYLERDIRELSLVGKLNQFRDFLVFMAARTSQELRYNEIAGAIGISAPTAREWISILEQSGIIYILRPYYSNITKRLVKTPKVYFMDTGLAAYLCRWPNAETLENGAMDGAFLETYVVSELVKNYYNAGKPIDLYYYRDIDKKEIDLLVAKADCLYPIEIKKSKTPEHADKNFHVLQKFGLEIKPGLILCLCDEVTPYNRDSYYCPVHVI